MGASRRARGWSSSLLYDAAAAKNSRRWSSDSGAALSQLRKQLGNGDGREGAAAIQSRLIFFSRRRRRRRVVLEGPYKMPVFPKESEFITKPTASSQSSPKVPHFLPPTPELGPAEPPVQTRPKRRPLQSQTGLDQEGLYLG
ncbi:hypothetical protein B0H12DRAFT_1242523 [Mycena haematopus]|nr:hypothetical protein B0H12DRAFT_1242523 [Mycena haematopus]